MKKRIILLFTIVILLFTSCGKGRLNKDVFVSPVPPQFKSEEEFLEEIKLIKNDKEKEKSTNDGSVLADMEMYYMPAEAPEGYELYLITAVLDFFHVTYAKKGEEYQYDSTYDFGYYNESSGWTMEGTIENSNLVQSEYSDILYFYFNSTKKEYRKVYYENDGMVCYLSFPFGADLDDKKQITEIENRCRMVKKNISG